MTMVKVVRLFTSCVDDRGIKSAVWSSHLSSVDSDGSVRSE